ncbi:MAG: hypothetical protein ACT4OM_00060 [Actinomycetota bacterium]
MFKASIILVVLAFAALAYGWVQGNDPLLYGSIALSALAGFALLRSTFAERKRQAQSARAKKALKELEASDAIGAPVVRRDPSIKSLGELQWEADGGLERFRRTRSPIKLFDQQDSALPAGSLPQDDFGPGIEGDDILERTLNWVESAPEDEFAAPSVGYRPAPRPTRASSDDFRSRLAAALSDAPGSIHSPQDSVSEQAPAPVARRQRSGTSARGSGTPAQPRSQSGTIRQPGTAPAVRQPGTTPTARRSGPQSGAAVPAHASQGASPSDSLRPASVAPLRRRGGLVEPEEQVEGGQWIRIEDLPRIARATQQGGGYARPELPEVSPPRRRPPIGATRPESPGQPRSSTGSGTGAEAAASATPSRRTARPRTRKDDGPDAPPRRRTRPKS